MINTIEELLQEYFNQSGHYLTGNKLEHIETGINYMGLIYTVHVDNDCLAESYEVVAIEQNDVLIWLYSRGEIK